MALPTLVIDLIARARPNIFSEIGLLVFYHSDIYYRPKIGFRERKNGEAKVIWLERENWFEETTKQESVQIARNYDVMYLFLSSHDFTLINPEKCAQDNISSQLQDIIQHRALDESRNIILLEERVLSFFSRNYQDLGYETENGEYWFDLLPLSYEEVINRTLELMKKYTIGSSRILKQAYIPNEYLEVYSRLKVILEHKEEIKDTILPFPSEVTIPRLSAGYHNRYSDDEILEYINKLYYHTYNEYMILVETNFQTIKHKMKMYTIAPWHVVAEINNDKERNEWSNIAIIPSDGDLRLDFTLKTDESRFNPETFEINTEVGTKKCDTYRGTSVRAFFEADSGKDNIIQHLVYNIIKEDLKQIFKWNIF